MSMRTQKETDSGIATYGFKEDTNTGLHSDAADLVQVLCGGTEVVEFGSAATTLSSTVTTIDGDTSLNIQIGGTEVMEYNSAVLPGGYVSLAVAGASGSSGVFASAANPFGYDVIITGAYLRITTQSTGASTLDIGIGADATTSDDGLIDGLSAATAGLFTNFEDAGTNGEVSIVWGSSQFLNVAEASGDVDGLVATLRVNVVKA